MGLETGTYINDLVVANPLGADDRSTADDHIRLLKTLIRNTIVNGDAAINPTPAEFNKLVGLLTTTTELNKLNGVTASTAEINFLVGVLGTIIDTQGGQTIADLIITDFLTVSGKLTANGELALVAGYSEDANSYGLGGAITLNVALATYFYPTGALTSIPTFTFSNPAVTGRVSSFLMELRNGLNYAPVWPASVDWANGAEPNWTAAVDVITFTTRDGGTTWLGFAGGLDMK